MSQLSNETLVDLIRKSDDTERKKYLAMLYQQNYGFIRQICKQYAKYEDMDDLTQEAFFGLKKAVEKYDPDQGMQFIGYASYWIKAAVHRYFVDCGRTVRLPEHVHEHLIKYRHIEDTYIKELGRSPSDEEIMDALSIDAKQLKQLKKQNKLFETASLNAPIQSEDDMLTLMDALSDPVDRYEELTDRIYEDEKCRDVWSEVNTLNDRSAKIIEKRFKDNLSLEEVGKVFGITKQAIRQDLQKSFRILSKSKKLRIYKDDYLKTKAYSGTGLKTFRDSGTSAPERVAIKMYETGLQRFQREIARGLDQLAKKYGYTFDEETRQKKIEEYTAKYFYKVKA